MSTTTVGDPYVFNVQHWLNTNYGQYVESGRYNLIQENGKTGWATINAMIRALQIELGISVTADNFGDGTVQAFNKNYPSGVHQQQDDDSSEKKIYGIIQGALLCKGYATGVNTPTLHFYNGTGNAIKKLKQDAGIDSSSSTVTLNVMKALLSMDYFYSYNTSDKTKKMQKIQRYLNANYEEIIDGLIPCDGIYGRGTNKALIYAIQTEEGMPKSVANGNCGPSTKKCLPKIPYAGSYQKDGKTYGLSYSGSKYGDDSINNFKKLLNIALYFNGFGSGNIDSNLDLSALNDFQTKHSLLCNNECDYTTWLSLLISCGDTSRSVDACDCATILTKEKAQTLYNNGYRRVGRYLSGTAAGNVSKALTKEELQIASDEGLYIFPIYQSSANKVSYFTVKQASFDVKDAYEHARSLQLPTGTNIYFAVDCDPVDEQITNYIIPYFKKLNEIMNDKYNNIYTISIYGTRNVCNRVSEKGYAIYSFVSDMSTGFSGNLGFTLPDNWSFDQITTTTIGSGSGKIEIDKDASSGEDLGLIGDLYLKDVGKVYYNILDMFNLAMKYTNNDISQSNMLVLQYLRKGSYGDTKLFVGDISEDDGSKAGIKKILKNLQWQFVAGKVDSKYCDLVDDTLYNLNFEFSDTAPHEMSHLAATLNALLYPIGTYELSSFDEILDIYAGWAGDVITFANSIADVKKNGEEDYVSWANQNICRNENTYFGGRDYIDDLDAYNLYKMIKDENYTLPEAFYFYYVIPSLETKVYDYEKRATKFINGLTMSRFNQLCDALNSSETPIKELNGFLASTDQVYIDTAINAFKKFVFNEYISGR